MQKTIFFMTLFLIFANVQGAEEGHVAKVRELYEEKIRSSTPENKGRKASDQSISEQTHLAPTFPQGHPSKELSDNNVRELFLVLYPALFKNKGS